MNDSVNGSDADDFGDDDSYDGDYESRLTDECSVGVAKAPLVLLQLICNLLHLCGTLPRAWMLALGEKFPDTSLGELRSRCPSLLPSWLGDVRYFTYQVRTYRQNRMLA